MLHFTSAVSSAASAAEDKPSQELGAKLITTDGKVAIYVQASGAIEKETACKVLDTGKAAKTGTGIACKTDYAIGKDQYGFVVYSLPTAA
nr:MAG TPA: hypothetical protein [Caudoviricetes sp.]